MYKFIYIYIYVYILVLFSYAFSMQTIDLSENLLTSAAGETLAKHFPNYTKLETLMCAFLLFCNNSQPLAARSLLICNCSHSYRLRKNPELKDAGAKAVLDAILVQYESVRLKGASDSGAGAGSGRGSPRRARERPNSVYLAFHLRSLDLSECGLREQVVGDVLPAVLRANVPLDTLALSQNMDVRPEAWAKFAEALAVNEELTWLALDYCCLNDANFLLLVSKGDLLLLSFPFINFLTTYE